MSRDWESTFTSWAQGPSKTEEDRISNVERRIRQAISESEKLKNRNIKVFVQGSYRNRVNVKQDSDIDIGVVCFDTFFPEYNDENIKKAISESFSDSTYTYQTFKQEIYECLVAKFGSNAVSRGNKAFDIKANSYRVEADVAAFFEHRRYYSNSRYHSGVEMIPDNGYPSRVRNWPEQHYENGVDKNSKTNRRYKKVVRIIKKLANEMSANGISSAEKVPGFLIECLVWNVPNDYFGNTSLYLDVRSCLAFLFNNTLSADKCSEWGEVSELKYLFRQSQPWSVNDTHQFLSDGWDYVGYKE
jgi:predicted nucleotidyltransferase